ncbi:MAG: Nif3-like dinuclear metal center hexameric protein [Ardenticatenales bacterium]|nr:Nif3-like dinuclear metal center hexameric protein [Ardenticatenales bacterium]
MKEQSKEKLTGSIVRQRMEELAPPALAESWDNVGWQVGGDTVEVRAILVSLDVDQEVVEEAARHRATLIVAHHPILFRGLKRIDPTTYQGGMLRRLLCEDISVFAAHTNLDAVRGGVNDALAEVLGLVPTHPLQAVRGAPEGWGFGAVCEMDSVTTEEMVRRVVQALGVAQPRVTRGRGATPQHQRVALLGGSGASMIDDALRAGCTLYITGEVKYHEAQDAARAGLTLIEAGHFHSERPVLRRLVDWLAPLGVPIVESTQVTSPFEADWKEGVG